MSMPPPKPPQLVFAGGQRRFRDFTGFSEAHFRLIDKTINKCEDLRRMFLKVAAIQFPLTEGSKPIAFLTKVKSFVDRARGAGADLIVFPELIATELVDWTKPEKDQLQAIASDFTPMYFEWLREQARASGAAILGGTSPRTREDGSIVNTAALAFANGEMILQDKLFLTPDEKDWGWSGGDELHVFDTPWGKTAITICFDCEFPAVSSLLVGERPDVILVPSWTSTLSGLNRVDYTARARAVEHYAYVVNVGTVPDENSTQPHFGQARLHTPQETGFPTAPAEGSLNKTEIVYAELDLGLLKKMKAKSGYYPAHEQMMRKSAIQLSRPDLRC